MYSKKILSFILSNFILLQLSFCFCQGYDNDATIYYKYERFISQYIEQQDEIKDDTLIVYNFQEYYPYLFKSNNYDGSEYLVRYIKTDSLFYDVNSHIIAFYKPQLDYKYWFLDVFVLDKFTKTCEHRLNTEIVANTVISISYSESAWLQFFTDLSIGEGQAYLPTTIEFIEKKQNKTFYERKLLIIGYSKEVGFFIENEFILLKKRPICR